MDLVYARCAGLDVHKATVVACVRRPGSRPDARQAETQTFATTLRGLEALAAWLTAHGVTHVAMESTGVYWRPVYAVLESTVELLLVNARHVKMVPGRKTDVRDCEWLAQLLECGLLRGSFVPPAAVRDLRDLTRMRKTLIRERGHHVNRIAKTLELANIKLGCVVTDLMGKTGRAILEALSAGCDDPEQLAAYAQGLLRKKQAALREAVVGRLTPHYAFLLQQHLALIDTLEAHIATLDARIEATMSAGPVRRGRRVGADHAGRGGARRAGDPGRDGGGHEPLPDGGALRVLGAPVSGQSRERGQAAADDHRQGRHLAARDPARGRLGGGPDEEELLPRALPPPQSAGRRQEGHRRRAARDARGPVAHAHAPRAPPGPRRRLLRPAQHGADPSPPRPPPRTARLPGPARGARGLTADTFHRKRPGAWRATRAGW